MLHTTSPMSRAKSAHVHAHQGLQRPKTAAIAHLVTSDSLASLASNSSANRFGCSGRFAAGIRRAPCAAQSAAGEHTHDDDAIRAGH
ncbi:hypothetical protein CVT25_008455 [Psilocybe cyanescens]|uniref:Uncharacterized protein n=1 Tax=Psilocybe cyanescens TaxID=93625 RepID=A0A409WUW3_PSICY|nr:hypothetical protein CVT25_008455 [Psilocybe cyanescens]